MDNQEPSVSKYTSLGEALAFGKGEPCLAQEEDDIFTLVEHLSESPGVQTIAVVDSQRRLVGIIPLRLLLDELFLSVAPEEFLVGMRDLKEIEEFGRISRARLARDLMQPPLAVTLEDTVREAFVLMHEKRLEGLPIIDGEQKVVGYLDRFQLIRLWLRKLS